MFVLGDENATIFGNIIVSEPLAKLPKPSCLKIRIKDISNKDIYSHVLITKEIDLSGKKIVNNFDYELKFRKPIDGHLNSGYAITAVLNIGWCHDLHVYPWIRIGDFLTIKQHTITLEDGMNGYVKDINIECYGNYLSLVFINIFLLLKMF